MSEFQEPCSTEGFSESVRKLVSSVDMSNCKCSALNLIADKVVVNSYVFHSGMEDRIGTEKSGSDIVTKDDWFGW